MNIFELPSDFPFNQEIYQRVLIKALIEILFEKSILTEEELQDAIKRATDNFRETYYSNLGRVS